MNVPPPIPQPWTGRAYQFVRRVVQGLLEYNALDHAATMSFYFFFGLIPLIIFAGFLLANFVEATDLLALTVLQLAPPSVAELIREQLSAMAGKRPSGVAPLSLLGFLILTSNGVHNLMDVLELVTRAPARPWWKQRLIAVGWVFASLVVGMGSGWLVLLVNRSLDNLDHREVQGLEALFRTAESLAASAWRQLGAIVLCAALLACGTAAFYRTGVSHDNRFERRIWPGAFVAIGCWVIFSWAFSAYVTSIGQYAVYYGSLATVAILMIWLYLTSLAVLLGAEVNAQLEGARDHYKTRLRPKKPLRELTPTAPVEPSEPFSTPPPAPASPDPPAS